MTTKEAVRQACKSRRTALSIDERWINGLTEAVIGLPQYVRAQSVMAYLAMPKEANLDRVIEHALSEGKHVYVPLCIDRTTMLAVRLYSLTDVETGVLRIRIPRKPHRAIDPKNLDFILVPGVGFDRWGGRMGMGNGYYDRFLDGISPTRYIGVCWASQLMDDPIPMDDHDQRMERIVTERGLITCYSEA